MAEPPPSPDLDAQRAAFRARLLAAMAEKGWSHNALARALGRSQGGVSAWFREDSDRLPDGAAMLQLPALLGVNGTWLLTGAHDDAPAYDRGKMDGWRLAMRAMRDWSEGVEALGPQVATPAPAPTAPTAQPRAPRTSGGVDVGSLLEAGDLYHEHDVPAPVSKPPAVPEQPQRRAGEG
jgi:transcriptional regulator with XRE-family HTH domain